MRKRELKVIAKPSPDTMTVMQKPRDTPQEDTVLVRDNEPEAGEYTCGSCGSTLLLCAS